MEKQKNQLQVSASGFVDEGDGIVSFPNGLTITDNTAMRSGTRYDINSLKVEHYEGQLTADHHDSLGTLIGKVMGVGKNENRVTVSAIKYAIKENPYARLAYNLLVGGFSNSFSIETIGNMPDSDGVYYDHELVGLSQVVVPNNYNAKINQFSEIVHNSLELSQKDGLDTTGIKEAILKEEEEVAKNEIPEPKATPDPATEETVETTEVTEEVAEVEAPETTEEVTPEETVEVETEEVEAVEAVEPTEEIETEGVEVEKVEEATEEAEEEIQVEELENTAEKADEGDERPTIETPDVSENKTEDKNEEKLEMTAEQIAEIVANAMKPLQDELAATKDLAQNAFDSKAKEPEFKKAEEVENSYDSMSADELFGKQLNAAVAATRLNSIQGRKELHEINERNLQALKAEKVVNAALTLEDLGNFVIGPEVLSEIQNKRTNYSALINATDWRETNSLELGWLTRTADIDMQNVAIGAHGDVPSPDTTDNRLKPISMPGYAAEMDRLEEMAAVTPISINVIKFAAADILSDVAAGYRNDYDRKRAQLVIARLQQAVNETGQRESYNLDEGLDVWALVVSKISDASSVGTLVFNNRTLAALKSVAIKSQNAAILPEIAQGSILGTPFIVVSNDLMPTLNTTETRTHYVKGEAVEITDAVFYGDLSTFTGRTSGGLKYDVAAEASYEIDGTVYSAYQRNEIVLRGSFFRGGVVKDPTVIAGIPAIAVS